MPDPKTSIYSPEIVEILHRLIQLRNRFSLSLPENLTLLKDRLDRSNLGQKRGINIDFDLFYNVGIVLTRQPEAITMGELSHALEVPLSTATRIVDWLVKNEYARRVNDPDDRRVVRVTLTGDGQEIYRTINEFLLQRIHHFLDQFTPDERENLRSLLSKIMDAIEQGL
jgi:DNA-binding MarR family transcriptional regulator